MTDSLAELLRGTADAVPAPQLDVAELVAQARNRQRRRRLAAAAGATALICAILVASFAIRGGQPQEIEPAPSPSPTIVDPTRDTTRPLVYAVGSTVHVGDRSIDANAKVMFVDASDDGVVFITDRDNRLWFDDGTTTESLGRVALLHVGMYPVSTANPGSLVVWKDGVSPGRTLEGDEFVVYDTARREEVARLPFTGAYNQVLHVDEGQVYFNPDNRTPGCWVYDVQVCSRPHLFRYDVASGRTRRISQSTFEAELSTQNRILVLAEARGDTYTVFTGTGAHFRQDGRRLVPTDSNGDDTVFTRTNGDQLRLRLPAGYAAASDNIGVVQWLDDDRVVLEVDQDPNDIGPGDAYRAAPIDLAVCRLPDGVCRIAVRMSTVPYLPPGQ
jgi:hypothetical protein